MIMARVQTVVQLDDRLIESLDRRAVREGVSRSHLIRQALADYLAEDEEQEISRRIIEGYTRHPQDLPDDWGDPGELSDHLVNENLKALTDSERTTGDDEW